MPYMQQHKADKSQMDSAMSLIQNYQNQVNIQIQQLKE